MGDPLLSAEDGVPAAEVPAALSDLTTPEPWKILVVDDDDEVHALTRLVLRHVRFRERPLQLIEADSAAAARECLRQHPDAALALVDVVMETPQAGLELVRHIREDLGNHAIRLILRTGQPGQAPEQDVVMEVELAVLLCGDESERATLAAPRVAAAINETAASQAPASALLLRLPADLAAILCKATQPEPPLGYPTANALATDVDAFLAGRVVTARRPTEV